MDVIFLDKPMKGFYGQLPYGRLVPLVETTSDHPDLQWNYR